MHSDKEVVRLGVYCVACFGFGTWNHTQGVLYVIQTVNEFPACQRESFWLEAMKRRQAAVEALLRCITFQSFLLKYQISTIRRYLAVIKFYHRTYVGSDLLPSHCLVTAVCTGIDRVHGSSNIKQRTRRRASWSLRA